MGANPFVSRMADVDVHSSGWLRLTSGAWISRLALIDTSKPYRFARLPHSVNLPNGWRLPTQAELIELKLSAVAIKPFTLPTVAMLESAGVPKPWADSKGKDTPAMRAYRARWIRSEEWCDLHDAEVRARLIKVGWNGEPVFNDGKHWGKGGAIFGWDSIQPWSLKHLNDTTYTDYATTIHAVHSEPASAPDGIKATAPIPTMLGAKGPAALAWQRWLNDNGYRDDAGALLVEDGNHGPKTQQATERARVASHVTPEPTVPAIHTLDLATIPYRAARIQYTGWPHGLPLGVCIHTSENTEHPSGAEVLQGTAARDDSKVSWHFSVDNDSITQSVALTNRAATAGPGNDRWIHIELFGRAGQGAAGWADAFSQAQLILAARLTRALCDRFGVPIRKVSPEAVLSGDVMGVIGHSDISMASGLARQRDIQRMPWWNERDGWRRTTHGDPGPTFPWEPFLALVRT